MSELRAPDPTLTALADEQGVGYDVAVADPYADGAAAHLIGSAGLTECGEPWEYTHPVHLARWFAVPCRTCFPDAPPPGMRAVRHCPCESHSGGPQLAWQIEVSNRGGESTAPRDELTGPASRGETRPVMSPGDRGGRASDVVSHTGSVTTEYSVSGTATPTTPLARLREVATITVEAGPWHDAAELAMLLDREDAEFVAEAHPVVVLALIDVADAAYRHLTVQVNDVGPGEVPAGAQPLIDAFARLDEVAS